MDKTPGHTLLFEAKTYAAHAFKLLVETLSHYLNKGKGGYFTVNKHGIFLKNTSPNEDILCNVSLPAENFTDYNIYVAGDILFNINLNTFYTDMLKKIRKKDSITLQIMNEDGKMFLKVIKESPDNKGNVSSAKTSITNSTCVPINQPTGYDLPVNILSKVYQQSCREISRPTNKEIEVTCWNGKFLRFFATKDKVVENEATFGVRDDTKVQTETFRAKFSAAHIVRPAKLAGLSETVKISVKEGLPLCYKMRVGCLGDIEIYIKTLEQLSSEKDTAIDEDEEE